MPIMHIAYLEKRNPEKNMYRFYAIRITPTLFGDFALIRNWGRIGANGCIKEEWCSKESEALAKGLSYLKAKRGRGYE